MNRLTACLLLSLFAVACGSTSGSPPPPEEEVTAAWTSGDDAPLEGAASEEAPP